MQSAITALINLIASRLAGVSPFLKAIVPSVTALVGALVNMAFAGGFDTTSIVILALGVVSSIVVFVVPNKAAAK